MPITLGSMETLADLFRPYKKAHIANGVGVSEQIVMAWRSGETALYHAYIEPLAAFLRIDRSRLIDACIASGAVPIGP